MLGEAYRGGKCETQFMMLPGEGLTDSYILMSRILPEQAKDRVRILISFPYQLPPQPPFFCGTIWHVELPQLEMELMPPAVEVWSLNPWTAREVPHFLTIFNFFFLSQAFLQSSEPDLK